MLVVNSVLAVVSLGVFVMAVYALVHAAMQRSDAYTAAGKLTKNAWLGIAGGGALLALLGLAAGPSVFMSSIAAVAAGVYITDVKPRLLDVQGKSR